MTRNHPEHVMGLHPSSRGFGWILFESAESPFDWGTADVRNGDNDEALRRVAELFRKYRPAVLALEAFEGTRSRRSARIQGLYRSIVREARKQGVTVRIYDRAKLSEVLSGALTRQQIAENIAQRFPSLRHRLPKPRKIWDSERSNTALFAAAACAIACFAEANKAT